MADLEKSRDILSINGTDVYKLDDDAKHFINKSTIIFGPSMTGKTTIIHHIMYLLKSMVPMIVVVCPLTSAEYYKSKVPDYLIHHELTKVTIENLVKRQEDLKQCKDIADDILVLENLYEHCQSKDDKIKQYKALYRETRKRVEENKDISAHEKSVTLENMEKDYKESVRAFYKAAINNNLEYLTKHKKHLLTDKESVCLRCINSNTRLMIIFDDVTEFFAQWMNYFSGDVNPFHSIFYRGRHFDITIVISCHSNKFLRKELRSNAHNVIYTSIDTVSAEIRDLPPQLKKQTLNIAKQVFDNEEESKTGIKKYRKYCYIKDNIHSHRYIIASRNGDFRCGHEYLWMIQNKVETNHVDLTQNRVASNIIGRTPR